MSKTMDIRVFNECRGEHSHDYPQILVPLQDSMSISVGASAYQVTQQELCFIPHGMPHECDFCGKLLVINLFEGMTDSSDVLGLMYPIVVPMQGQIVKLVDLIQLELKQNPNSGSIRHLYSYLYSKLIENCEAPSIRYIGAHYDLPITVEQLAAIENYSVSYYNDWFKRRTGVSPSAYLRGVRIGKAKELLAHTSYDVIDVAIMVGYGSSSTFTRAFHSATGTTPKSYRNRRLKSTG